MTDTETWPERIAVMGLIRQEMERLDTEGLWRYHLPAVRASADALAAAERALRRPLDPKHRVFLSYANGWPAFYQDVDLFGTGDYLSHRIISAREMLHESARAAVGWREDEAIPIAASATDRDLFVVIDRQPQPGPVVWLAGEEVQRFSDFDEFFLSMMDYNRLGVERLHGSHESLGD